MLILCSLAVWWKSTLLFRHKDAGWVTKLYRIPELSSSGPRLCWHVPPFLRHEAKSDLKRADGWIWYWEDGFFLRVRNWMCSHTPIWIHFPVMDKEYWDFILFYRARKTTYKANQWLQTLNIVSFCFVFFIFLSLNKVCLQLESHE